MNEIRNLELLINKGGNAELSEGKLNCVIGGGQINSIWFYALS